MSEVKHGFTTDYSKFQELRGNRSVTSSHANELAKAIKRDGGIKEDVVINENWEVVDGQHRIMAAKLLSIPVPYVMHEGLTLKDAIIRNTGVKPWSMLDLIHAQAINGDKSSELLETLVHEYEKELTYTTVLAIANGGYQFTKNDLDMVMTDESLNEARNMCKYLCELLNVAPKVHSRHAFCKVVCVLVTNKIADKDQLISKFSQFGGSYVNQSQEEEVVREIQKIYNIHRSKEKPVYFEEEFKKAKRNHKKGASNVRSK